MYNPQFIYKGFCAIFENSLMGNSPLLCDNSGCVVPIAAYTLFKKFDSGTIDKTRKLFNFRKFLLFSKIIFYL